MNLRGLGDVLGRWVEAYISELISKVHVGGEALMLAFAYDVKLVSRRTQHINLHSSLTPAWGWTKKWDQPINPARCNCDFLFFPDGSGTPIPVYNLINDLGIFLSAQCTEVTNKARRLIYLIRRSFQDTSRSAFIPYTGLSALAPRIWYTSMVAKPRVTNPLVQHSSLRKSVLYLKYSLYSPHDLANLIIKRGFDPFNALAMALRGRNENVYEGQMQSHLVTTRRRNRFEKVSP